LRCYPFRRIEYQRLPGRHFWDMGTTPNFSEAFHHFDMTFYHIRCTEYDCQTRPLCLKLQRIIVSQSWGDEDTSMPPACVFLVVYVPPNILPRCSKSGKETSPHSSTKDPCLDATRTLDDSLGSPRTERRPLIPAPQTVRVKIQKAIAVRPLYQDLLAPDRIRSDLSSGLFASAPR
jgi:hypothetical protein